MKPLNNKGKINGLTKTELKIIFVPIVIIICFVSIFIKINRNKDYYIKSVKSEYYEGMILRKYRDYNNHGSGMLTLQKDNQLIKFYSDEWLDLWNLCNIGDYIKKDTGELQLQLIRKKESDTIFVNSTSIESD